MRQLLIISFLSFAQLLLAQNRLVLIRENDKYGYMNFEGKKIIDCIYDEAEDFNKKGFARVRLKDKYGMLKADKSWFLEPKFDFIKKEFEGYIHVYESEKTHYFVDMLGERQENTDEIEDLINKKIREDRSTRFESYSLLNQFSYYENWESNFFVFVLSHALKDTVFQSTLGSRIIKYDQKDNLLYVKYTNQLKDTICKVFVGKNCIFTDNGHADYSLLSNRFFNRKSNQHEQIFNINIYANNKIIIDSFTIPKGENFKKIEHQIRTPTFIIETNKHCYLVDTFLRIVQMPKELTFIGESYNGNRWVCNVNGECGILNSNFKWPIYDIHKYGLYNIGKFQTSSLGKNKIAVFDIEKGNFYSDEIYEKVEVFKYSFKNTEIRAFCLEKSGQKTVIDEYGKTIIPFGYDTIFFRDYTYDVVDLGFPFAKKGKYYYVFDMNGNVILKTRMRIEEIGLSVGHHFEGPIQFKLLEDLKNAKVGLIDADYRTVFPPKYESIRILSSLDKKSFIFKVDFKNPKDSNNIYFNLYDRNLKKLNKKPLKNDRYKRLRTFQYQKVTMLAFDTPNHKGIGEDESILKVNGEELIHNIYSFHRHIFQDSSEQFVIYYTRDSAYYTNGEGNFLWKQKKNGVNTFRTNNITYMASPVGFYPNKKFKIDSITGQIETSKNVITTKTLSILVVNQYDTLGKYYPSKGQIAYLCNNTQNDIQVGLQDGTLSNFITEALDSSGIWRPIEYLQGSWCGNSYYSDTLKSFTAYQIIIRKYQGQYKTKLRLNFKGIYSNEFEGNINYSQFYRKIEDYNDEINLPNYFHEN